MELPRSSLLESLRHGSSISSPPVCCCCADPEFLTGEESPSVMVRLPDYIQKKGGAKKMQTALKRPKKNVC